MRGVTGCKDIYALIGKFQLTRLMRGVTAKVRALRETFIISTHTPHARRDVDLS